MSATKGLSLIPRLCRANYAILEQKVGLITALTLRHGSKKAADVYRTTCPIVKATMGQHVRHSLDHIERACIAAETGIQAIHYDLRERGGVEEYDMVAGRERILFVQDILQQIETEDHSNDELVKAYFMLSGDSDTEYGLQSTVARELGFAAHHAIHHMALIRIIALGPVGHLSEDDLPADFGRAPSTVRHNKTNTTTS